MPDVFRLVRALSMLAALALVAQSEWMLARAVGWPPYVAWLAPVALDAYVLASVLRGKDLRVSVAVSTVSVFASHALYAAPGAWVGGAVPTDAIGERLTWPLAAICSVVPLLVMARIHSPGMSAQRAPEPPDGERLSERGVSAGVSEDRALSERAPEQPVSVAVSVDRSPSERDSERQPLTPVIGQSSPSERQKWAARHAARKPDDALTAAIVARYGVSAATARRDAQAVRQRAAS